MKKMNILDINNIFNILPHRYPFLLIDRIIKIKKGEHLYAIKNITINEPFFKGHFPYKPIFPGVLILESIAQASGFLGLTSLKSVQSNAVYYLVSINNVRFKKIVVPGDQMLIKVIIEKNKGTLTRFRGLAKVNHCVVCTAVITCVVKQH
jgi:3-hydroxyacyl-[acyl-carrier-protein] dehydratase